MEDAVEIPEGVTPKHVPAPLSQLIDLVDKGLSYKDIGRLCGGISGQAVSERLSRHGYKPATLKALADHETGLSALRRSQLLESMTPTKMKKASLKDTGICYGILKDKHTASQTAASSLSAVVELIHKDGQAAARVTVQTGMVTPSQPGGHTGGSGGLPASEDGE